MTQAIAVVRGSSGLIFMHSPNRSARPKLTLVANTAENCPLCANALAKESIRQVSRYWAETENAYPAIPGETLLVLREHNGTCLIDGAFIAELLAVACCHHVRAAFSCTQASIPGHAHANLLPPELPNGTPLELPILNAALEPVSDHLAVTTGYSGRCIVVTSSDFRIRMALTESAIDILNVNKILFNMVVADEKVFIQPTNASQVAGMPKVVSGRELAGIFSTSRLELFYEMTANDAEANAMLDKSSLSFSALKIFASYVQANTPRRW